MRPPYVGQAPQDVSGATEPWSYAKLWRWELAHSRLQCQLPFTLGTNQFGRQQREKTKPKPTKPNQAETKRREPKGLARNDGQQSCDIYGTGTG